MKFIFYILIVLIFYGCQPKDTLDLLNANFVSEKTAESSPISLENNLAIKKNETQISIINQKKVLSDLYNNFKNKRYYSVISIVNQKKVLSDLYNNFKNKKYYSIISIKISSVIKIGLKPKLTLSFNYKNTLRKSVLNSYKLYFEHKNHHSILDLRKFLNNDIKIIKLYFGQPYYIRQESNIVTWQFRYNLCVIDFFYNNINKKILFIDMRPRKISGNLNKGKCIKESLHILNS